MADNKKSTNTQTIDRIKKLQKKIGLNDDGVIGPVTLSRIEAIVDEYLELKKSGTKPGKVETPTTPPAATVFSMIVSKRALDKIVEYEISSEEIYNKKYQKPIYPGGDSGATIGIGYDLGFNTKTQIDADWRGKISDADLDLLKTAAGVTGANAKDLIAGLKSVSVQFAAAREVFYVSTLPRYAKNTRGIYPGIEHLPADAQGALLSLIYNRGTKLTGDTRKEMNAIVALVAARDLNGIAAQITAMKRLWDKNKLSGLHARRDDEAKLVKNARPTYAPEELIKV
jgi:GH24 family phage-related lysozyme (muramidase)